ncbi:MAG: NFYB/HAP3 family transcription factor subunit [DPANN group archaeon]|nr:NFYB/HAP3 family transcription factor subunit [DPANN group archaeon]
MADEEVQLTHEEEVEEEVEDEALDAEQRLPFPTAAVVREMKKYIDKNKQIKKDVKVGMNKFLGELVENVSQEMDKNPYSTMDYRMFEEAVKPYKQVKELQKEKDRLNAHMDVIIKDAESIKRDLEAKFSKPATR